MLDCGFGIRDTESRLSRLGVSATDISGILVTHEHQDHISGVCKFARRHRIPVWLSFGTFQAIRHQSEGVIFHICRDGDQVVIGDLCLSPYTVPHDACEPVQFHATDGQFKIGVLTDAGQCTPHIVKALDGCDALVLECNHDRQLLADSEYPPSLKRRIGGAYGHLSNQEAAEILASLDRSRLMRVVGAHLSKKNNLPDLAHSALCTVIDDPEMVSLACQDEGFDWINLKT